MRLLRRRDLPPRYGRNLLVSEQGFELRTQGGILQGACVFFGGHFPHIRHRDFLDGLLLDQLDVLFWRSRVHGVGRAEVGVIDHAACPVLGVVVGRKGELRMPAATNSASSVSCGP